MLLHMNINNKITICRYYNNVNIQKFHYSFLISHHYTVTKTTKQENMEYFPIKKEKKYSFLIGKYSKLVHKYQRPKVKNI